MLHSELEELSLNLGELINNEEYSDIKVFIGKERKLFFVNSSLLASRSILFKKMFFGEHEMKEKQNKEWIIKEEIKIENFKSFINFIYTGKVIITPKVIIFIYF